MPLWLSSQWLQLEPYSTGLINKDLTNSHRIFNVIGHIIVKMLMLENKLPIIFLLTFVTVMNNH